GKCPFVLIALRSCRFNASIAFVVYTTRRSSGGKARNGVTYSQAFSHACVITGKRDPHLSSKASSAAWAASASTAVSIGFRSRATCSRSRRGTYLRLCLIRCTTHVCTTVFG